MATYNVIDVSSWQGKIDWKKVKAAGITGAIIRYADGDIIDNRFKENMKNAKAAGLHVGSYIFSRAKTKAEAEKEAQRLYKATKEYSPDLPLYIDLEAKGLEKVADTTGRAFLKKMKELGGRGGIYANLNWWNNYLKNTVKYCSAYPFWIAQYYTKITHKNPALFGMWQYTSSGFVNGINGRVDRSKLYVAYWKTAPKPAPTKKAYTGPYPNIDRSKMLIDEAVRLAWPKGTATAKYKYPGGSATSAFKTALNKVYPNRSSWGKAAKVGASCDVFVGTVVRSCGIDSDYPRGLKEQFPYNAKGFTRKAYKNVKPFDKSKNGDIVMFDYSDGGHTVIRGNGYYYEANYDTYYGHTNTSLARLKKSFGNVVVLSPKNYLAEGDTGAEVKKLKDYLIWYGYRLDSNGIFSPNTTKAVKLFQTKEMGKAEADGIVGAKTLAAMKKVKK